MSRDVKALMIDSGAFSVWNNGSEVDLDAYIAFCREYVDVIDLIVALDVIPGRPKDKASLTRANISAACEKSWENYKRMIESGLPREKVLPVFHQNDDWKWLELFMKEEIPYFGLSPANDSDSNRRQMWLDTCMKFVCGPDGMPLAKFHGFAVTSVKLMARYPWYSVDSVTWMYYSRNGAIIVPHRKADGSWDYFRSPQWVFVSTKVQKNMQKWVGKVHYLLASANEKKALEQYLELAGVGIGKSAYRKESLEYKPIQRKETVFKKYKDHIVVEEIVEPGVSNDPLLRGVVCQFFFDQVAKQLPWPRPFKGGRRSLL